MNSRILATGAVLALAAVSQVSLAGDRHDRGWDRDRGYARVIDVQPVVERVRVSVPVENCWVEGRERGRTNSTSAAIVGGAVGALLGNNIGRGDGRKAATIGGALVGAVLGSEAAKRDNRYGPRYEEVQHCRTQYEEHFEERVAGYRVTYLHHGRRAVTRLPYDPGRYLRLPA